MLILQPETIIKTTIFLTLLVFICTANIYLHIRSRKSEVLSLVQIASSFCFFGVAAYLLDTVTLNNSSNFIIILGNRFFIVTGLFLIYIVFKYIFNLRSKKILLRLLPDLKSIFSNIDDLIIVMDYRGVIVNINNSKKFNELFKANNSLVDIQNTINRDAANQNTIFKKDNLLLINEKKKEELYFSESDKYFIAIINPILSGSNKLGLTFVFHDITEIKKYQIQIKEQNEYLDRSNKKLSEYIKIALVLEAENERLKLLESIQSELINKIENVAFKINQMQKQSYEDEMKYRNDIKQAADELRSVYSDVRKSIKQISTGKELQL